jgi:hypothetical protein
MKKSRKQQSISQTICLKKKHSPPPPLSNYISERFQRSEYDKGRFWPNLRNCLYRYNKISFCVLKLKVKRYSGLRKMLQNLEWRSHYTLFIGVGVSLCKYMKKSRKHPLNGLCLSNYISERFQRSEYDKGRFWPNLRNCLYRYNIKHNH